jgi:hypothetical protein
MQALSTIRGDFAAALEEQAIAHFHDVGFVDRGDLRAAVTARVLEGGPGDSRRGVAGNDFEAFDHPWDDLMLEAGVKVLRILTKDRDVDRQVMKAGLQTRQHADGPEIGVETELLAQRDIDALVAAADGSRGGALEADAVRLQGGENVVWDQLSLLGKRSRPGLDAFPLDRNAGRLDRAHRGIGHFGSDAVAGYERYLMSHHRYYKVGGVD